MFSLAQDIVKSLSDNPGALMDFLEFLQVHILELVRIDPQQTYRLFRSNRYDESKLLNKLRKNADKRFELLTAIIRDAEERKE